MAERNVTIEFKPVGYQTQWKEYRDRYGRNPSITVPQSQVSSRIKEFRDRGGYAVRRTYTSARFARRAMGETGSISVFQQPTATPSQVVRVEKITDIEPVSKPSKVEPKTSLFEKTAGVYIAGSLDPSKFYSVLGGKVRSGVDKLTLGVTKYGYPYDVKEIKKAERKRELIATQTARLEKESKIFDINVGRIGTALSGARTEAEVRSVTSAFPEYKFSREGDVLNIQSPELRARSRSLAYRSAEVESIERGAKVPDFSLETIGRAGVGFVASVPSMPFTLMSVAKLPATEGVKAFPIMGRGIYTAFKEKPVWTGTQVVASIGTGYALGKLFKPKITIKRTATGPGKTFYQTRIKEGVIFQKGRTVTRYKDVVYVNGEQFGKPYYYRQQRTFVVSGRPQVLGVRGDVAMIGFKLKGSTVPSPAPKMNIKVKGVSFIKDTGDDLSKSYTVSRTFVRTKVPVLKESRTGAVEILYKPSRSVRTAKTYGVTESSFIIEKGDLKFNVLSQKSFSRILRRPPSEPKFYLGSGRAVVEVPPVGVSGGGGGGLMTSRFETLPSGLVREVPIQAESLSFGGGVADLGQASGLGTASVTGMRGSIFVDVQDVYAFPVSAPTFEASKVDTKTLTGTASATLSLNVLGSASAVSRSTITENITSTFSISAVSTSQLSGTLTSSAQATKSVAKSAGASTSAVVGGLPGVGSSGPTGPPLFKFLDSEQLKPSVPKTKLRRARFVPKYTPSVEAGFFNIKGLKPKKITGLELRPILR